MAVFRRFANLFRRSSVDRDIDAELQGHIAMRVDANIAAGMSPGEARRQALLQFGNPAMTKERIMEADTSLAFGSFWRNVRFALRQLRRSPGFALTAILALALGIGPNVAIFSIIWATFLAPTPYPNANQLVVVWNHYKGDRIATRGEDYAQYAAESHSFQSLSFLSWLVVHLTNPDHTADVSGGLPASPGLQTKTVGEPMELGRDFLPDEGGPGNDHVVILSHWLWQYRYNADRNILGKSILVEDQPYTVIGVTPAGPNDSGGGVEFNVPIRLTPGVHSSQFGIMIGRLKPGVTLAQAQAELSVINTRLSTSRLLTERGGVAASNPISITVEPFRNDWLDIKTQRNLWLLLAAVGLVLLIACANIANLLLARGTSREQELAVRAALGATRRQIFAQLLTESLTLALSGGAIGIAMGWGIMKLSMAIFPDLAIQSSDTLVEMNLPVLCFSITIAIVAGVISGCAPSWRATRLNLSETLKQGARSVGGRGRTPLQSALVTSEIALALVLLAGAGMALHSFWNLSHIDVGFKADHVMTAELRPRDNAPRGGKPTFPPPEQIVVQHRQLLDRIRAIPGVADAAFTTTLPLHGTGTFPFSIVGQPVDQSHAPMADFEAVSPSYFNTLEIRLVSGRFLRDSDTQGSPPVVMVNETFVHKYLANDDPLTHALLLATPKVGDREMPPVEFRIVGVFHDVLNNEHLTGTMQPEMYITEWQAAFPYVSVAVRSVGIDPASVTEAVRRAVASVESGAAIDHVEIMQEVVEGQRSTDRFEMVLFGGFAAVALLLAAIGIYGVMAFAVAQRSHEIGVRMALGARRSEVVMLIVRGGVRLALFGITVGLAGAYGLGRIMRSTLYGVESADLSSLPAVAALLFTVAVVACWIPARRAARVDPMQALRAE